MSKVCSHICCYLGCFTRLRTSWTQIVSSCIVSQVGLLVSAPLFAEASKHYSAFRLMAVGLGAWIVSTAGCAFSIGQIQLSVLLAATSQSIELRLEVVAAG